MNVCSYHLQEAGATPVQELAYSLATAIGVLDAVPRLRPGAGRSASPQVFGSISFFVNAGIRFVEEVCKLRAFGELWDRIGRERYGVEDPKARRFRYGVQVNSLGLTEAQPENNVQRIVLEMLGRDAVEARPGPAASSCRRGTRRSACPARGTSSGRCGCNRCSRSRATSSSTRTSSTAPTSSRPAPPSSSRRPRPSSTTSLAMGGAFEAVETLKCAPRGVDGRAHPAHRVGRAGRRRRQPVHRDRAVAARRRGAILRVDPAVEAETVADVARWRADRDGAAVAAALDELRRARRPART